MDNLSIKNIMEELVSIQSDTGSQMEVDIAKRIYRYFQEDKYFKEHPDYFGWENVGDALDRPVLWALKKGKSNHTIILTGHYDAVEIECYGTLKSYALNPSLLKDAIKQKHLYKKSTEDSARDERIMSDLLDENWCFGRGTADMKGGLAIGIYETLTASEESEKSVLFIGVSDEENLSAGGRNAATVLLKIKEKLGLDYDAVFILEPQLALDGDGFMIYNGSIGKMMPMIVAKGKLAHCGEPLKGLNSAHLLSEIVSRINLNTDLTTENLGLKTQVPMVQYLKDLKETYDVSIPEYSAAYFNLLFVGEKNANQLLEKIMELAAEGANAFTEKYRKACTLSLKSQTMAEEDVINEPPLVISVAELKKRLYSESENFENEHQKILMSLQIKMRTGQYTVQEIGITYIKQLLELFQAGSDRAVIAVGLCPPYYPPVNNREKGSLYQNYLRAIAQTLKTREEITGERLRLKEVEYFTGIGDGSYFSCVDPREQRAMLKQMILPTTLYDIPVEEVNKIEAPCFYLGPRCQDIHQWSERVYMPDLEVLVPEILENIIGRK